MAFHVCLFSPFSVLLHFRLACFPQTSETKAGDERKLQTLKRKSSRMQGTFSAEGWEEGMCVCVQTCWGKRMSGRAGGGKGVGMWQET